MKQERLSLKTAFLKTPLFACTYYTNNNCTHPYIPASLPRDANANFVSRHAIKEVSIKCFWIFSVKISPAFETPPPIKITSGLTTHAILESVEPKISQTSSTRLIATSSPAFASSNTSFAVNGSNFLRVVSSADFANFLFASLTIPVADVYCSKHPYCPQLHASISS